MFEAFYNSLKPIDVIKTSFEVVKAGKIPKGVTELPFEFELKPSRLFFVFVFVFFLFLLSPSFFSLSH